ncbi:tRNA-dependent cyclodipeptide synthase [Nocardiopsis sp. EMB25]|uniref:tRNA-dependent cyclodipeptide synthase n=1 Tax=Nocardiopsis sp. EMB25 TaxID=2835867 RepID=UPI0022845D76|nr:tRNA-dependent cyclodipeptide synthase [Nocardiopsis sp. EMB25]MCY9783081.1 tRNA-dependent cyclodipeptide synthase [Nocardiopsis sp. EMB25]
MGPAVPTITVAEFEAIPFTVNCSVVYDEGEHLLVGASPGNGYFTRDRVAALLTWARRRFDSVDVVYADREVDTMLVALGYSPDRARRRANKDIRALHRRILQGIELSGSDARCTALSEFEGDPTYVSLRSDVERAMLDDPEFTGVCERTIRRFLLPRRGGTEPTAEQVDAGMRYLARELPFFLDTPAILGVGSSVSCYHVEMPLTELLLTREHGLRAVASQAYATVRPLPDQGVR